MKYEFSEKGFQCGSKTYVGECIERDIFDIGYDKFDGKLYHYPGGKYQVVKASEKVFRVPIPGCIDRPPIQRWDDPDRASERTDNLLRARTRIQQIILCNEWNNFLTITYDPEKIDSTNVPLVIQKTQNWLKNMTKRNGLAYLLVPEYHKKEKRVHCHALTNDALNIESNDIYKVEGIKKPLKESTIKKQHIPPEKILYPVYNCPDWKHGFSTAIDVYGTPSRLANYVLKYITKENEKIFGRSYWCSKNLKLYPDIELYTLGSYEFRDTPGRQYYHRGSEASFKYINRLGDEIKDMSDDEETI